MKRHKQLLEDYYAAMAWLHLDFAAGVDDNLVYMNTLIEQVGDLKLTDDELDTLDMAWREGEMTEDFSSFERAILRVLKADDVDAWGGGSYWH